MLYPPPIGTMAEFSLPTKTSARRVGRPSLLNARTLTMLAFAAALAWSLAQAGVWGRDVINERGWPLVWRFVHAAGRPDLSPSFLRLTLQSTLVTLAYAVCGTTLSLVIGGVGGMLGSEVWWHAVMPQRTGSKRSLAPWAAPWLAVRTVLALPRAIHEVIWGLFFINIIGLDPLTAILAIAIPFGAITAKVFAEILDETPRDVWHAVQHSGVSPFKALLYSIIPQAFPDLLSYAFYRFECAIRAAAVLGLIGAGGLGYQILLSLQSLRYEQMWTLLWALIALTGLTDLWSSWLRRRLHLANRIDLNAGRPGRNKGTYQSDLAAKVSLVLAALLIPFAFWYTNADLGKLFAPRTMRLLGEVVHASFPPRWDAPVVAELFRLGAQTLSMSILAMSFAGAGGLLLSFPAARNVLVGSGMLETGRHGIGHDVVAPVLFVLTRGVLLVARALGEPIWALLVLFVLFPGVLPGALALGLYNLGILGRLMAEVTENVDRRPLRALAAGGASGPQVFLYGVLPTTVPRNLLYVLYRWEVCIRATVVVGLVGAGGLGRLLTEQLSSFDYRSVVTTLIFFIGLTIVVDFISAAMRRAIR
jgi:phosphonate transport system permease protein